MTFEKELKNYVFWNNTWFKHKFSLCDRINLRFDGFYAAYYDKDQTLLYMLQCQTCGLIFLSKNHYHDKKFNVRSCPLCSTEQQKQPIRNVVVFLK